nr:MAG TPA: hypothetical protein [Caudoviricetes sp.]
MFFHMTPQEITEANIALDISIKEMNRQAKRKR